MGTTVEKGEASSTTSSPKTEQQLLSTSNSGSKIKKEGPQVSPVSSTHPGTVTGESNMSSPNSNEEDGGVSSTTKELDIKANLLREQQRDLYKSIKKEVLDPFSSVKKDVTVKCVDKILSDKTDALFSPTTILQNNKVPSKHDRSLKENKNKMNDSSSKDGKRMKDVLSIHGKDRKSSSSSHHRGHDVHRKMKEIKDREMKDFFSNRYNSESSYQEG